VALSVTIALLVGLVLLSTVVYVGVSRRMAADIEHSLVAEAEAYAAAVAPGATTSSEQDLISVSRAYLSARTSAETGGRILLVRFASGKVLSNSALRLESAPDGSRLLEPARAGRRFGTVHLDGGEYRVATVPVADRTGRVVAVFEAAISTASARQMSGQLGWTLFGAGFAIVLLGAALSALVARSSLRPLRAAARTASSIDVASLHDRVDYAGADDEVGSLVRALNAMLDRLQVAAGEQRRFVADASHELRTPLAVIRGHVELLSADVLSPEDRTESYGMVLDEIDRMSRLIDDLLRLARLDAGAPRSRQPVELRSLLAEAVGKCAPLVSCATERRDGTLWVSACPDDLQQVVLNLVCNAATHAEGASVELRCFAEGDRAIIEIADNGPGIPDGDIEHLFERFYRTRVARSKGSRGSGLGLAIVQRIVEMYDGTVSAHNGEHGGAVFRIDLPRTAAPAETSVA